MLLCTMGVNGLKKISVGGVASWSLKEVIFN